MQKKFFFWLFFAFTGYFSFVFSANGANPFYSGEKRCWVFFSDKKDVVFDPYEYFDQKAIKRRLRQNISLYDSCDFPVNNEYLQAVKNLSDSVIMVSRWINAAKIFTNTDNLERIRKLPFVRDIWESEMHSFPAGLEDNVNFEEQLTEEELQNLQGQISAMKGQLFHKNGYDGSGVRIAIFDAGFPSVDTHPVFKHLHANNRIIKTWDFYKNRPQVSNSIDHGTMVLSVIGGIYDSIPIGLATGAEYLLARTEIRREPFSEEEYWLAAMEWADKNGADIINSSLGYSYHRYFPEQMDGESSLVARAAAIAFSKGIFIINSAGNSGDNESWEIISTPADSPHVLAVGAVGYPSLISTSWSSRGPSADGRIKPELSAVGEVIAADASGLGKAQGTSFASPLLAGFAACLWQMFPDWTNQDLSTALKYSGHLFPYFDYHHGYGIPQADYFFQYPGIINPPTFDFIKQSDMLKVKVRDFIIPSERISPLDTYLYYHIADVTGRLQQYFVVLVEQQEVVSFDVDSFEKGQKILVHYRGFTSEWIF